MEGELPSNVHVWSGSYVLGSSIWISQSASHYSDLPFTLALTHLLHVLIKNHHTISW